MTSSISASPTWITTRVAATLLGVSPERVRQLCREGRLVHERTPDGNRISLASLRTLAASRD